MDRIAVVGIGKIRLCLALNLERAGYDVLGIDKSREHVKQLGDRTFRSPEPGVEAALRAARAFRASDQLAQVRDFGPALVLVAGDTPPVDGGGYDHCQVDRVMQGYTEILDESPPLALAVWLAHAGRRVVLHDKPAVLAQVRAQFGPLFEYQDGP